ncbi:glyoxalase superfamily protein [Paraburkholderia sp. GAS42]|jgi:hypothetical protein
MFPGVEQTGWGRVMEVFDPFGNWIRFCELSKQTAGEDARRKAG